VLQRAMRWDFVAAAIVAAGGAVLGGLFAGAIGAVSGVIGGAVVAALTAITASAIHIAGRRATGPENAVVFIALVAGSWLIKLIVFIALAITLRGQSWIQPTTLFLTIIVGVAVSLVVEVVIVARSRVLYVPDADEASASSSRK
jgi:hypothetical protein